jgi:hypothetical protein
MIENTTTLGPNCRNGVITMESRKARSWYLWLWFSPLFTLPTLAVIALIDPGRSWICRGGAWSSCDSELATRLTILAAIFVSALWHLIILMPSLNKKEIFVRWHGYQMLLLAGLRTLIPAIILGFYVTDGSALISFLLLVAVWLFGTGQGQAQAARGECSLMRWMGQEALLPSDEMVSKEPATISESSPLPTAKLKSSVNIIRHSPNQKRHRRALSELRQAGLAATTFGSYPEAGRSEQLNTEVDDLLEVIRQNPDSLLRREALEILRLRGLAEPL